MSYPIATAVIDTRAVIEPVIEQAWVALGHPGESIEWPNVYFTKPGNGQLPTGPWLRVSYTEQVTDPLTFGGGTVLNLALCILQLQIFAPKNDGAEVMHEAADAFRSTFERKAFGNGIYFRAGNGPQSIDDSAWAGRLLSLPFEYFEAITT